MDHFRYRNSVKVISYLDMGFSLLVILSTILASIAVFALTFHEQGFHEFRALFSKRNSKFELGRLFAIIWILSFTFNILQFFAACALLSGTDLVEEEDSKSIQKCRFWQMTSIFLFLVIILLVALHPIPILIGFALGEFVFRAVGIYLVGQFVGELEEESNLNSSSAQLCYYDPEIDPTEFEQDVQEF
ncbi:unnamed protein product [Orchesella dallaii]|uniref:Uncharacterized protein n=1 Tax=Orchesella dallaii TaxID=48710 RepID=A0ABP1PNZ1_9HEXA